MPDTRDAVFSRVMVDHLVRGVTRVSFELFYQFPDPPPWHFRLQVGETGVPAADDWADVGLPVTDAFALVDPARRDFGQLRTVHYRVVLETARGAYTSRPAAALGLLGVHDWLLAREVVRKELLRHRLATVDGWLLKRRRSGPAQPAAAAADPTTGVLDPLTGDIIARTGPAAATTLGTEFVGGYYAPAPFALDVDDLASFDAVDPAVTGTTDRDAFRAKARALLIPALAYRDVFVARHSDLRYELGRVEVAAHQRGVPLVGNVAARLLPFADIVYTIPVPS